jgi:hypothetical protein
VHRHRRSCTHAGPPMADRGGFADPARVIAEQTGHRHHLPRRGSSSRARPSGPRTSPNRMPSIRTGSRPRRACDPRFKSCLPLLGAHHLGERLRRAQRAEADCRGLAHLKAVSGGLTPFARGLTQPEPDFYSTVPFPDHFNLVAGSDRSPMLCNSVNRNATSVGVVFA